MLTEISDACEIGTAFLSAQFFTQALTGAGRQDDPKRLDSA